ncbi:MAG: hypothetical protein WDO19_17800 [Bacteroidota bacterium]
MIISANPEPQKEEFITLLKTTLQELNLYSKKSPKEVTLLAGNKLEPFIMKIMSDQAIGSVFENSIELVSGQKFPDIIANKYYGVEVKSTTQNHWKTTGNSVLESTRVDGIERIYMLFGKLGAPIEFRFRPYEECLSEVVVTHSPRYLIDMNLAIGSTIFDKMNIKYDDLRTRSNPIKPVVEYYKSKLKQGDDIWWLDQGDNSNASNLIIKIWSNLNTNEKLELKVKSMAFFPEVFSNNNDKFGRLAIWLITKEAVVCPNIRDIFTAGGKTNLIIGRKMYKNVPKIFKNLFDNLSLIVEIIFKTTAIELSEHWHYKTTEKSKLND